MNTENLKLYTVYDNKTDEPIIIDGTAKECAEAMGIKVESFYHAQYRSVRGMTSRWSILLTAVARNYPPDYTFGSRLRNSRIDRELTISQLSSLSGLSTAAISNLEHGRTEPTLFTAVCLADSLEVSLDYLAGRDKYYKHTEDTNNG